MAKKSEAVAEQTTAEELAASSGAEMPKVVIGKRMVVHYVRPHFARDKDDKRSVALEFSLQLDNEHRTVLPKFIINEWELMKEGGRKMIELDDLGLFYVEIGLAPEPDSHDLEIAAAPLQAVKLASIEDKGTGEAKQIIRLSFRVLLDLDAEVEKFACRHFGKLTWLQISEVQGKLGLG